MHKSSLRSSVFWAIWLLLFLGGLSNVLAKVQVARPFGDHMVLQRGMAVPIWGQADAGEKVTVRFQGQEKVATADANGSWRIKLDPLKAGGPHPMTVAATNTIQIRDVLVGEVWVGSGQSNMAGGAAGYAKRDPGLAKVLAAAPYPRIRLMRSPGNWTVADANNAAKFSALLLAFGHGLHKELDVPVGLIVGAVGGTPSGSWLSREAYEADQACRKVVAEARRNFDEAAANDRYRQSLAKWEKAVAKAKKDGRKVPRKPGPPAKPGSMTRGTLGGLYERFVRPVAGYGIRGVLWDQGESGTRIVGVDQYTLMGALIRGWRSEWGQGDFPFLYVQKPSGGGCAWDPSDPVTRNADKFSPLPSSASDGAYRELHIRIRNYPKTFMVTASDLGSGIHPTNKWGYGQRAVRVALGAVYGKNTAVYGPTYESHTVEGDKVRVRFANVGKGLAARHDSKLKGFAIAVADKVFHWAEARIDGDSVVLWSEKVASPVAVRYAWSRKHPWANLFNLDGLPALTFRTDQW